MQGQKITFKTKIASKLLEAQLCTLTLNEQRRLNISVHNAKGKPRGFESLINVNCFPANSN